jgi:DNA repair protein RadC
MKKEGLTGFQDHELLELLLFYFIPRRDTNKIAHELLNKFDNFSNILDAPPEQLMTIDGISEVTAYGLATLKEVWQRYVRSIANNMSLSGVSSIIKYAKMLVAQSYVEKLVVVFVDNATQYLSCVEYCSDSRQEVQVNIKSIVTAAMDANAAGVILFHCHVRGNCMPSDDDFCLTEKLFITLANLDIVLLEHIIFNNKGAFYSFFQEKDMDDMRRRYLRIMDMSIVT